MPTFEINEFIVFVMLSIGLGSFVIACRRFKVLMKYLPGFMAIWITALSTNAEAFMFPEMFNLIEHLGSMLTGVLMLTAVIVDSRRFIRAGNSTNNREVQGKGC